MAMIKFLLYDLSICINGDPSWKRDSKHNSHKPSQNLVRHSNLSANLKLSSNRCVLDALEGLVFLVHERHQVRRTNSKKAAGRTTHLREEIEAADLKPRRRKVRDAEHNLGVKCLDRKMRAY